MVTSVNPRSRPSAGSKRGQYFPPIIGYSLARKIIEIFLPSGDGGGGGGGRNECGGGGRWW